MFSMMSISPQAGQFTVPMSFPSIQKAGQIPCPRGSFKRASNFPCACSKRRWVVRRAEVYSRPW
jgi:hypothetical protein